VHCTSDHAGMIDFCIKLEHVHDMEFKLKGTNCMDCNQKYDEANIIPSTKRSIRLCNGYMRCRPVRCRKSICYECATSQMLKQQEVVTSSTKRPLRNRKVREKNGILLGRVFYSTYEK
jgi:hypothetical protein